jgi:hypothetical protein
MGHPDLLRAELIKSQALGMTNLLDIGDLEPGAPIL